MKRTTRRLPMSIESTRQKIFQDPSGEQALNASNPYDFLWPPFSNDLPAKIICHVVPILNPFHSASPLGVKALACVSKAWNAYMQTIKGCWLAEHKRLNAQKELVNSCQTAENAIDFIIENKLEVA